MMRMSWVRNVLPLVVGLVCLVLPLQGWAQASLDERRAAGLEQLKAELESRLAQLPNEQLAEYESRALTLTPYTMVVAQVTNGTAVGQSFELYNLSQDDELLNVMEFSELTGAEEEQRRFRSRRMTARIINYTLLAVGVAVAVAGVVLVTDDAGLAEHESNEPERFDESGFQDTAEWTAWDERRDDLSKEAESNVTLSIPLFSVGAALLMTPPILAGSQAARWRTPALFFDQLEADERVVRHNLALLDELGAPDAQTAPVLDTRLEDSPTPMGALVGRTGVVALRAE